jgi:hypothetical protein
MTTIFAEPLALADTFDPFLLRELIHNDYLPELIDPTADISQADWEAYHADMQAIPMDLPTPEEVLEMAKSLGLDEPPF